MGEEDLDSFSVPFKGADTWYDPPPTLPILILPSDPSALHLGTAKPVP